MYADDFDSKEKERAHQNDGQSSSSHQPVEKGMKVQVLFILLGLL